MNQGGTTMKDSYSVEQDIREKYRTFVRKQGRKPRYAHCRIKWNDDATEEEVIIKLSAHADPCEDDSIFFYCNNISEFSRLTKTGMEDFILIRCFGFE